MSERERKRSQRGVRAGELKSRCVRVMEVMWPLGPCVNQPASLVASSRTPKASRFSSNLKSLWSKTFKREDVITFTSDFITFMLVIGGSEEIKAKNRDIY